MIILAAAISAGIYMIVPDILNPVETVLFLWTFFVIALLSLCWLQDQAEQIRTKRESLCIRKNRRSEKIVDFRMRSRVKYIPAFKVRRDA